MLPKYFLVEDLAGGGTHKTPLTKMKGAKDQLQYRPQQQGAARVTLWVGKTKYLAGGKEELVRVSNTIEVNLEEPG